MSFPSAALLAVWVVLVLMAFAMAGLLRQQRDLQAAVLRLGGRPSPPPAPVQLRPTRPGATLVVVIADRRCTSCPDVLREFLRLAPELADDLEAVVLTASAAPDGPVASNGSATSNGSIAPSGSDGTGVWAELERSTEIRLVVDPAGYHLLDPGWRPALLQIDHAGAVLRTVPVGSPAALAAALSVDASAGPAG